MKITKTTPKVTEARLVVIAEPQELETIKKHVFQHFARDLKVPGFRQGKLPLNLVEKYADSSLLQSEFLEHAINDLYPQATRQAEIRPVDQPQIDIKKFVPFTILEFEATVAIIGKVKLGNYKKPQKPLPTVKVTSQDIDEVIEALRARNAGKTVVARKAQVGDEVVIDFKGLDAKKAPVKGAEGQDYPLTLGSQTFIPGFEENLVGMAAGQEKTFTVAFPADYGVKALAKRKITFTVTVKTVQELALPELDAAFAASVGPVKTVEELKSSIKSELEVERQRQANLEYESTLVRDLANKSTVELPDVLIQEEVERLYKDLQQNLVYRGQTIQEFLAAEGTSEEAYKKGEMLEKATERVKAGIILAEIAEIEKLQITPEELEIRIQSLKSQYKDDQMRQELDKPENRREIVSRMLSEKTVAVLSSYAR